MWGRRLTWAALWAAAYAMGNVPAWADDLHPPDYRGQQLTGFFHWAAPPHPMGEPPNPIPSEPTAWELIDDDDPSTLPSIEVPFPETYFSDVNPVFDVWTFILPNFIDIRPMKLMRIQLTWEGISTPPGHPPEVQDLIGIYGGGQSRGEELDRSAIDTYTQPPGGYMYFDYIIEPNPEWEYFDVALPKGMTLQQIVVDTISIPEPSTLLLAAIGMVFVGAWGRGRRLKRS
jgi:hypothetical protein